MGAVAALTLKPSSATERPAGTTLDAPGLWTRLTTASPVPNTHPAIPAAETERHNAAVRLHRRDSEDSVPVLPETAERRRQLQQQQKPGTGAGDSPRHHLRPCTLDYHEAAVLSAERLRMPQRRNSLTPSFDGALQVRRAGKDVTTPVSFGVSALTKENVLGAKVSPAAGNLAAAILGGLYQGGTPLPPDSVQNYLAGDIWGLASPRA